MEPLAMSTYEQYHTPIVFTLQSFLLPLTPDIKSVLVIYFEDYLRNMMTHLANILVYSTDILNSVYYM
jgi:hypothetical protein